MVKKKGMGIGTFSFIALTVLAVLAGIGVPSGWTSISLVLMGVFGIIAGFANIKDEEVVPFLISIVTLVVGGAGLGIMSAFDIINLGAMVSSIVSNLAIAYIAMGVVVALKTILTKGKN